MTLGCGRGISGHSNTLFNSIFKIWVTHVSSRTSTCPAFSWSKYLNWFFVSSRVRDSLMIFRSKGVMGMAIFFVWELKPDRHRRLTQKTLFRPDSGENEKKTQSCWVGWKIVVLAETVRFADINVRECKQQIEFVREPKSFYWLRTRKKLYKPSSFFLRT